MSKAKKIKMQVDEIISMHTTHVHLSVGCYRFYRSRNTKPAVPYTLDKYTVGEALCVLIN